MYDFGSQVTVSRLEQKEARQLREASSTLEIFATRIQSPDLLIFLTHTICFSYRRANTGRKHSQSLRNKLQKTFLSRRFQNELRALPGPRITLGF